MQLKFTKLTSWTESERSSVWSIIFLLPNYYWKGLIEYAQKWIPDVDFRVACKKAIILTIA